MLAGSARLPLSAFRFPLSAFRFPLYAVRCTRNRTPPRHHPTEHWAWARPLPV